MFYNIQWLLKENTICSDFKIGLAVKGIAVLTEELGLVPSIHVVARNMSNLVQRV